MSNVKLSEAGAVLLEARPELGSVFVEFGAEDAQTLDIDSQKSYRGQRIGAGSQAIVYSLRGEEKLAEKVWHRRPRQDRPHDHVSATFDRQLEVRSYWEQERPSDSKLYLPDYYASVEHPDTIGAILMERVTSSVTVAALDLYAAPGRRPDRQARFAQELGVEPADLAGIAAVVKELLEQEESFYRSLFDVVPLPDTDDNPENILVEYDPSSQAVTRLAVIDV